MLSMHSRRKEDRTHTNDTDFLEGKSSPEDVSSLSSTARLCAPAISKGHYLIGYAVKFWNVAKNSIGITDTGKVYAYRIKINAGILRDEIDRIKDGEWEIWEKCL